eukprot:9788778-Alexandrium_andersonii.AAC.1
MPRAPSPWSASVSGRWPRPYALPLLGSSLGEGEGRLPLAWKLVECTVRISGAGAAEAQRMPVGELSAIALRTPD